MKKIFLIVLVALSPMYCLGNNVDNSFKMKIDAISLNNQITKDYYITDYMDIHKDRPIFIDQKNERYSQFMYYQEAALLLEQELNKQQYKKILNIYADVTYTSISLQYSLFYSPKEYYSFQNKEYPYTTVTVYTPFHKSISIEAKNNYTKSPFWLVEMEVRDDNINLRMYIPSMIKCVAPYFNKNFKGTVTCKR